MFTFDQVREFTQKIDDYVNKDNDTERTRKFLQILENEFSEMFQYDKVTRSRSEWFTFRMRDSFYILKFQHINDSGLRMFCINKFAEQCESELLEFPEPEGNRSIRSNWKGKDVILGETTLAHEFIYRNCNPEGVLLLEKILFKEIM